MSSSPDRHPPLAVGVEATEQGLKVRLNDGRVLIAPLDWFPRLAHATSEELGRWEFIGQGLGIHWPDLDEDVSVESLLAGRRSGESQSSLNSWLQSRKK